MNNLIMRESINIYHGCHAEPVEAFHECTDILLHL